MKFTNYYKEVLDTNGVPPLNLKEHRRLFNIIFLEGQLTRIDEELEQFGYNAISVAKKDKIIIRLDSLYGGHKHPASVFSEMIANSNFSGTK